MNTELKSNSRKNNMTKHDDKIKLLLAKVEEQQNNLGVKPKASWNTNGIFKYKDGTNFFNLNTVRDAQPLVEALACLLEKESLHQQAAERLGVAIKPFLWDGNSICDWEKDFKKRLDIIGWEARKAQLDDTKKKLKSLVSEEAKTEMELEDIEKSLT